MQAVQLRMKPQLTEFLNKNILKFCQGNDFMSEDDEFDSASELFEAELGVELQVGASSSLMVGARKAWMFAAPKSDEEFAKA